MVKNEPVAADNVTDIFGRWKRRLKHWRKAASVNDGLSIS